jgi:Type II secretion system (T2SS), protein N
VRLRITLLGLVAFAIALAVVLPAAWFASTLPPQARCASLSGSIWSGQCRSFDYAQPGSAPLRLDSVDWKLNPLALLRGRVQADVAVTGPGVSAQGEITLQTKGRIRISGLSGNLALDHGRLAALPSGWSAQGEAQKLSIDIITGRLAALDGVLLAHKLRDGQGTDFGDFRLEFPRQEAPPYRGTLADQGGPMQLQSQLQLNADQSWQMQGTVVLRPGSPPGLAGLLDQLAPADLNGLRTFRLEGTAR